MQKLSKYWPNTEQKLSINIFSSILSHFVAYFENSYFLFFLKQKNVIKNVIQVINAFAIQCKKSAVDYIKIKVFFAGRHLSLGMGYPSKKEAIYFPCVELIV